MPIVTAVGLLKTTIITSIKLTVRSSQKYSWATLSSCRLQIRPDTIAYLIIKIQRIQFNSIQLSEERRVMDLYRPIYGESQC